MTSIVLGAAGAAIGTAAGGPIGAAIGYTAVTNAAQFIHGSNKKATSRHGRRLADLSVQTSTYGKMIPEVYGTVRIAGNIIWSREVKETAITSSQGGGKGGSNGRVSTTTNYSYSATLAIALCAGPIDGVLRVWADTRPVAMEPGSYRLYMGDEAQLPDPLIESYCGVGSTPAYRGIAYVVMEDFPLAEFGNHIPNFTFEVQKRVAGDTAVEDMITAMVMIPGSGEFVYDTIIQNKIEGEEVDGNWVQKGDQIRINQHGTQNKADALVSLDQLQSTCKNLEWVAPVVAWFADHDDAGECVIRPGVEYNAGAITAPDSWVVAGFSRETAYLISRDAEDNPVYGGSVNDASLLRYLDEVKARGLNILFYPLFFMDTENKPWRGRLTGSAEDVAEFFTKENGYNDFILHYADLVKEKVDAFIIGSELIGLTSVKDEGNNFPAVDALVELAASVKAIVGSGVKVTYAADWSEYHHTEGGWYNMDPLWASPHIDMVGIDAYFPLTDASQNGYDLQLVMDGWDSGEGYDFVYTDEERTIQEAVSPEFAWKNIAWWWENNHVNPDDTVTDWVPESKKIWFTEYGFPSVDACTNQPNVFYDPSSSESYFPRFSKGRVDIRAQRLGLTATELKWQGSEMVERKFVWTWDARPYPCWPDLHSIWADGGLWRTGHWVEGKLGVSTLAAVIADLTQKGGLEVADVDVSRLTDLVEGYALTDRDRVGALLGELQGAYFFDALENGEKFTFIPRGTEAVVTITEEDIVRDKDGATLTIVRMQEQELPERCDVTYMNKAAEYQIGSQQAERLSCSSLHKQTLDLPLVLTTQAAKTLAEVNLYNAWMERTRYHFHVGIKYAALEAGDVILVVSGSITHTVRITSVIMETSRIMRIDGVAEDVALYGGYNEPESRVVTPALQSVPTKTELHFLDVPPLPGENSSDPVLWLAGDGLEAGWKGAVLYRSADNSASYAHVVSITDNAVCGKAVTVLGAGTTLCVDMVNMVTVLLTGGELESVSQLALLNGANAAKIGEEIVQFQNAELIEPHKYVLSGFLRGRLGTEEWVSSHVAGEVFVLLDGKLAKTTMDPGLTGLPRYYKAVTVGRTLGETEEQIFTYSANALKPFSPVHIKGERDGEGNLTVTWVRRTRINGQWQDYSDVPLGEESEAYHVEIMDALEVVRTVTDIAVPSMVYSAEAQIADFGVVQEVVTVRVYQISAVVGRGKAGVGVV